MARAALAEHRTRRFPGRTVTLFEAGDVAMVAAYSSAVEGDRDAKTRAQLDAMNGAFEVSKGKPTVRFIWQRIDHFLEHEQRGRRRREREDAESGRRSRNEPVGSRGHDDDAPQDTTARLSAVECSRRYRIRLQLIQGHHSNGACPYCNRPAEAGEPVTGRFGAMGSLRTARPS